MSFPEAGTSKIGLLSQEDYLSPLPIPTGERPRDMLNSIWLKNEVFLDVGSYSIGAGVMGLWPLILLSFGMAFGFRSIGDDSSYIMFLVSGIATGIPALMIVFSLFQPTPLPIRFNRQRREVCVPRENGEYWIVPWESVTAAASQYSYVSQAGNHAVGMLFIVGGCRS